MSDELFYKADTERWSCWSWPPVCKSSVKGSKLPKILMLNCVLDVVQISPLRSRSFSSCVKLSIANRVIVDDESRWTAWLPWDYSSSCCLPHRATPLSERQCLLDLCKSCISCPLIKHLPFHSKTRDRKLTVKCSDIEERLEHKKPCTEKGWHEETKKILFLKKNNKMTNVMVIKG